MDRRTALKAAVAGAVAAPAVTGRSRAVAASPTAEGTTATPPISASASYSVAICEQNLNQIQVYPAAAAVWDDTTIQWRFAPGSANGWDLLDEVKFRASSAFGTLALVTASGGRAAIVQVSTGNVLWSATPGGNPHAIERIPDIDAIVVASSGGEVTLYGPTNSDDPSTLAQVQQLSYPDAHGLWYDDLNSLLWVVGGTRITGYTVSGSGRSTRLAASVIRDLGPALGSGLHSLDASYANSGALLITDGTRILTFDKGSFNLVPMPTPSGFSDTSNVKSYSRDVSGESFWVKVDPTYSHPHTGYTWVSPTVQFFDASGNPTVAMGPAYNSSIGAPEIYKARLFNPCFH